MTTTAEYPNDPQTRRQCGTYAGVQQHNRHGERQCRPCLDAGAAYLRAYRRGGLCGRGLGWPLGPNDPAPKSGARAAPKWARETGARA